MNGREPGYSVKGHDSLVTQRIFLRLRRRLLPG
jgi:hypothetical protein